MAFVRTLDLQSIQADVIIEAKRALAIVPIGYDDEEDKSYNLFVGLDPHAGGDIELSFCLVEYDRETDSEHEFWEARDVRRFMSSEDRSVVLAALLRAIANLVNAVRPAKVFLCTMESDGQSKSERKYAAIAQVFAACGYEVHCADIYHGQRAWWMERK